MKYQIQEILYRKTFYLLYLSSLLVHFPRPKKPSIHLNLDFSFEFCFVSRKKSSVLIRFCFVSFVYIVKREHIERSLSILTRRERAGWVWEERYMNLSSVAWHLMSHSRKPSICSEKSKVDATLSSLSPARSGEDVIIAAQKKANRKLLSNEVISLPINPFITRFTMTYVLPPKGAEGGRLGVLKYHQVSNTIEIEFVFLFFVLSNI